MRRKRCSRPSLKESTSGRCNYDLACYFSFLFPTSIFPLLPLSLPLCFPFSLLQRGKGMKGCSTKMGKCLFERDNETRDKTLSLLHPNSLSLSLSLERFFILVGERGGKIVWRSFSFYSRARFLSTSTIFGDEFLPRFRIFKKSSLDHLDISNTYRPFKSYRRFNIFRVVFELGFRWGGIWRVITVETLENGEPSWISGPCTGALEGLVLSFDPC